MGYTLLFKSLKGTDYRLIIDGGGTLITGAATPLETTEDANADMFTPVRTQSGYFRFIGHNDHSTWMGMIPVDALSKPVKLYTSNVIKWQGFITPQVYQNEFPGIGTQIHEIPVQCPLSVLDTIDVDININNHPVVTFGQLLQEYIFNAVTTAGDNDHISITGYHIQGTATVTAARLNLKVMWANFVETDSTGTIKPKYTYKQVLEEFCKFFGYTCRMHGSVVYFTMPVTHSGQSDVGFTYYGASGLWNSSTGQASAGSYSARGSFSITDDMLVDTNNNEEVHPGVGKVTVRSDINVLDNLVEIPYDELFDRYNTGVPSNNIIIRALDQGDEKIYYLIREPDSNGLTLTYENDSMEMTCYSAKFDGDALTKNKYCRFLTFDSSEVGDPDTQEVPESKKAYGWRNCVELFHGTEYTGGDNTTMFTITSKQAFVVSGGVLYVSWKMMDTDANLYKLAYGQMSSLLPRLTAQLRVGDMYWSGVWDVQNRMWQVGAGWTTTPSTFTMYLDPDGPKTTRNSILDPQYDGCGVPVSSTLRGVLEFKIIDVQTWQSSWPAAVDNNGFVPMHDFEIGFVRGVIEDTKHRGNEYVKSAGAFRGETNVDLIFACDVPYGNNNNFVRRMPAGLGYILTNDTEVPAQTVPVMNGDYLIAEEELAVVMAAYGDHTHRLVQLDLRTTLLGAVDPTKMSATTEAGMSDIAGMFPLAISHNWRDDVTILTLIAL